MVLPRPYNLRRDFASRAELIGYVREQFPAAAAYDEHVSTLRGGRTAAVERLNTITPGRVYRETRNNLDGAVTRLSAYLRHGVLSLREVRDTALLRVNSPQEAEKFISELAWRDYWQRVYAEIGNGIWVDREPYKTGLAADDYQPDLPADIASGTTGFVCMDAFSRELRETGYLHNHARMWLAAYVIHWRRVRWQTGARWFLQHLLDGDPASNNLSWQWVASTFGSKPYYFNRETLERFTQGIYCRTCPLLGRCAFEGSYPQLEQQLFPGAQFPTAQQPEQSTPKSGAPEASALTSQHQPQRPIIWIHGDNLNPRSPALREYPRSPAIFVFDNALLQAWRISLKRLIFIYECLLELPVVIRRGEDLLAQLLAFAHEHTADGVVTMQSPAPRFAAFGRQMSQMLPVRAIDETPFVNPDQPVNLNRFSRYWQVVRRDALDSKPGLLEPLDIR